MYMAPRIHVRGRKIRTWRTCKKSARAEHKQKKNKQTKKKKKEKRRNGRRCKEGNPTLLYKQFLFQTYQGGCVLMQ